MRMGEHRRQAILRPARSSEGTISYYDNFAAWPGGGGNPPCACRWEVLFNGAPCTNPGRLVMDAAAIAGEELRSGTVTGYCSATSTGAIPAGTVTLAVRVGPAAGFAACQCRTGYLGGTGLLEAEELP